jgi:hypothetical protein
MNLILIDLKQYNHPKLKELAEHFDFNAESLVLFKDNGVAKIWVDLDTKDVVTFTIKKDNTIRLGDQFMEKLLSLKAFELPKKPKSLSLDSILEKISNLGINSLTTDEKNYLDNLNK